MEQIFVFNPRYAAYVAGKAPFPTGKFGCTSLWVAALVIGAILPICLCFFLTGSFGYWGFEVAGVPVLASITEDWEFSDGHGGIYYFRLNYPAMDDHNYEAVISVNSADYNAYSVGDALPILYVAGQPTRVRLAWDRVPSWVLEHMLAVWGIVFGSLTVLICFAWKAKRRQTRLAEQGFKLSGKITTVEEVRDSEGGELICIHYEFQPPGGAIRRGCFYQANALWQLLPVSGTPIAIQYVDDRTWMVL